MQLSVDEVCVKNFSSMGEILGRMGDFVYTNSLNI